MLLVEAALDDTEFLEPLQPRGQGIGTDSTERVLEILEPSGPLEEQVAEDQDRRRIRIVQGSPMMSSVRATGQFMS